MTWRSTVGLALVVGGAFGTGAVWTADTTTVQTASAASTSTSRAEPDSGGRPGSAQMEGAALFRSRGCSGCHGDPETGSQSGPMVAPGLADASSWAGERRPGLTAADYLAESMREPGAFMSPRFRPRPDGPLQAMPDLNLTDEEIDALVEYLLSD